MGVESSGLRLLELYVEMSPKFEPRDPLVLKDQAQDQG